MSARATWKGFLQISLVTIPIKVYPATESSESLSFNQLHDTCQTRVTQKKWCARCERDVPSAEIVKGFEFEKGRYVLLRPEELDAVQPPSTRVIDLVHFADVEALDPMYIDRTYYLAPGVGAGEAYGVMRDGMTGKVGVGKLALYGREYLVAVRVSAGALVLHTLHHAAELRRVDAIDDLNGVSSLVADPAQVKLARHVIAALSAPTGDVLDLVPYVDAYRAELQRLIDAKIAGKEIVVPAVETPAVVDLRAALVQSLEAVRATKKLPAPATVPKRKRAS